ncbi:hypothetical protein, partial [Pallidibacillus thermolactis]|uniref:hypothetical protein n=1 Tax=Pallidibacillus thermolactis TaxID=251051 RepID=UPI0021D9CD4F
LDMEKTMSSLNKIRILENDEQKKTNPNSNEAFELGFVDSLKASCRMLFVFSMFIWIKYNFLFKIIKVIFKHKNLLEPIFRS